MTFLNDFTIQVLSYTWANYKLSAFCRLQEAYMLRYYELNIDHQDALSLWSGINLRSFLWWQGLYYGWLEDIRLKLGLTGSWTEWRDGKEDDIGMCCELEFIDGEGVVILWEDRKNVVEE